MELDRAIARAVGIEQQAVTSPLLDSFYTPDELEVLEDEPAVPERPQLVRGNLRKLGVDLMDATTASRHDDWAAVLQAVRLIQGRAVVTRGLLERMLGQDATAAVPPLVHVVREIGRLISGREVDSLPPDELRVRMRAVLQALDRELKALLSPPDGPSIP